MRRCCSTPWLSAISLIEVGRNLGPRRICQNHPMRLTPIEQQVIREASLRNFGVRPRLQGVEARLHRVADIWKALDERKIDMGVNAGGEPLPIFEVAQREGVWL